MAEDPTPLEITTRDQAEAAGAQIVALRIQHDAIKFKKNRADFAAQKLKRKMDELLERIARYETVLSAWAKANRKQEFGESKTLDMRHVVLVFKNAPRCVRLLKDWTDALVIAALQKRKTLQQYIRIKREVDRQRILSDSKPDAGRLDEAVLKSVGIEIVQEENFFIEPKLEEAKAAA